MTYLEVKKMFIELSGRTDLVSNLTTYAETSLPLSASHFINEGSKLLDMKTTHRKELAWYKKDIGVGDFSLNVLYSRAFKEVWLYDADGQVLLEKRSLGWMMEKYAKAGNEDVGIPAYWTPAVIGMAPSQLSLTAATYTTEFTYGADGIYFGNHFSYNGIMFMPPADGTYTIGIMAKWFEKTLSADSDVNNWTVNFPMALVEAALYFLEVTYKNREGMADHLAAVDFYLKGLLDDAVDEEVSGETVIRG